MDKFKAFFARVGVWLKKACFAAGKWLKKACFVVGKWFKSVFVSVGGNPPRMRTWLKKPGVQTAIASIICALIGILVGFLILLCISPDHALKGITDILRAYFRFPTQKLRLKNLGNMLVNAAPLIMCSLSVLFAYKTGLFNIGVAGQFCVGICATLFAALAWGLPWYLCLLFSIAVGAIWGMISGAFKAFFNVNEVIACIMTNWIGLYLTNIILSDPRVMNGTLSETYNVADKAPQAIMPSLGLSGLFGSKYVTIAIVLVVVVAIAVSVILNRTTFGYELKATGLNKHAAKYAGMKEKRNVIVTMAIAGGIAAAGASFLYLSGIKNYITEASLPATGFNGIAVAFLGGLNPIGVLFAGCFIQHIMTGGAYLDTTYYNAQIADLMVAVIIYLCAFVLFFRGVIIKRIAKIEKKAELKAALASGAATAETKTENVDVKAKETVNGDEAAEEETDSSFDDEDEGVDL